MIAGALGEIEGLVDKRFLLNAFFPCLVWVFAGGWLVASGTGGVIHWIDIWERYSGTVQAVLATAVLAGVFVTAAFLMNNLLQVTRLYEGYLAPRFVQEMGTWWQGRRMARERYDKYLKFPEGTLRPTALGNVLGAAEDYPGRVYGSDAPTVWPRLFPLLPESFVSSAGGPLDSMNFLLVVSLLSAVFAVAGGTFAAVAGLGRWTYLLVVGGGGVLSWLAYRSAVQAAVEYGLYIRVAFDLYRNDLLRQLRRPLPATIDEERRLWGRDLTNLLDAGEPCVVRYVDEPKP